MAEVVARVITVSDSASAGEREDLSGPAAVSALAALGIAADLVVVPDGVESVTQALLAAVRHGRRLVVTTGGTGFTERDVTPEATSAVIERSAPGLSEAMRSATFGRNPHGMLSRGVSGIVGNTLILNLPGSVSGVAESLETVGVALPHAMALLVDSSDDHGHTA